MFNGLASLFFGAVGDRSLTTSTTASSNDHTLSSSLSAINYTTTEAEGDWLLVESSRRRSQGNVSGASGGPCIDVPVSNALRSTPESSVPSSPTSGITLLDGSWYITPPPCFTADSPANVETSPMENLLIEHPSMSVYASCTSSSKQQQQQPGVKPGAPAVPGRLTAGRNIAGRRKPPVRKCGQANPTSNGRVSNVSANKNGELTTTTTAQAQPRSTDVQDSGEDEQVQLEPTTIIEDMQGCQPALISLQGPRNKGVSAAAAAAREELLLHVEIQAHSQKAIRERDNRNVHGRQLERHNKVLEYQSLGKRQRRKDFMKNHSGANNNRKC